MGLSLASAIIIFIIVVIILFIIFRLWLRIRPFSSLALSIIVGIVVLNIIYPISQIINTTSDWVTASYIIIQVLALIFIFIYVIMKSLCDREYGAFSCTQNKMYN